MKLKKHLALLRFGWALGAGLRDKLLLSYLLSFHIGINRRWWSFPNSTHHLHIVRGTEKRPLYLRNNGTDIAILSDLFGSECYGLSSDYSPKVIVDAGANIGIASVYLSMRYPQAVIHCFEPVEVEMCRQNATTVHPHALGKQAGELNILIDPKNSGGHRLELYDSDPSLTRKKVAVHRLDQLIAAGTIPAPDFLKIDAEGAECDIVEGLGEHLHGLQAIVAETQSQANHRWLVDRLQANGFASITERIVDPTASLPSDAYSIIAAERVRSVSV